MDNHRIHSISNYLLGEDLILEISLPELQTYIKKYCPDFPDQTLKGMNDSAAKVELMNMGNSIRAILEPAKPPVKNYNNALAILLSYTKGGKVVPYPYPKTAADLNKQASSTKAATQVAPVKSGPLSTEAEEIKKFILKVCPKYSDSVLETMRTEGALKAEVVKIATAVHNADPDPKFPKAPVGYVDSKPFLERYVDANGPIPYPYSKEDIVAAKTKADEKVSNDLLPFPGDDELLVKYYNSTIDYGWPGLKVEMKNGKIVPQADSPGMIPFSLYYKSKVDKETNEVKPYNMPKLVQKAKNLVEIAFKKRGAKKIKELISKVETIIEADKKYKMSHKVHFRDKFAKFVSGLVRVLGGNEADDRVLNWLVKRSETMTVFEFQKLILDEVYTKNTVTNETALKLAKLQKLIRDRLSNRDFILSGNKGNSWIPGESWFTIENARKISPVTVEHAVRPMLFYLASLREMINDPIFKREFDELPNISDIDAQIKKIKEWAAAPKDEDKIYTYGADQNVLTCKKTNDTEEIELRPVFNDRAGVSVYITFSSDGDE